MPRIRWSRFVLLSSLISLALPTAGRETGKAKSHLPLQTSHRLAVMQSSHNALAYLQNGNLYVKEMPGEPARCFLDNKRCYGSPLWSPEGKWVAIHERGTDPNSESINLQIVSRQGKGRVFWRIVLGVTGRHGVTGFSGRIKRIALSG